MGGPHKRISLKCIECIVCLVCIVVKAITDQKTRQTFLVNQKLSREWSLLNSITWTAAGNTFTNVTFGEYAVVTSIMAITSCVNAYSRVSVLEKILLTLGIVQFGTVAGLVLAAIDQIPSALLSSAIIVGVLSAFVVLLFLIDLSSGAPKNKTASAKTLSAAKLESEEKLHAQRINGSFRGEISQTSQYPRTQVDNIEAAGQAVEQQPVFAKIKTKQEKPQFVNIQHTNPARDDSYAEDVIRPRYDINRMYRRRSMDNMNELIDDFQDYNPLTKKSQSSTYIKAPHVDNESTTHDIRITDSGKRLVRHYYPDHQHAHRIYVQPPFEDESSMLTPGYVKKTVQLWETPPGHVKKTAQMWETKAPRELPIKAFGTIV